MYSYKECEKIVENREMTITELMKYLWRMRKKIGVCFILFFVIISMCCFVFKYRSSSENEPEVTLEQLDESQQKRVKSVLRLYSELKNIDAYKADSAYMSLNPFQCDIVTVQYLINADDEKIEKAAYESYQDYINYGGVKEIVNGKLGDRINTPSDLVEIVEETSADKKVLLGKSSICVKVVAPDFEIADEIIQIVKESINSYYPAVKKSAGEHSIEILSENSYSGKDESLLKKQEFIETTQSTKQQQITNLENSLSEQEKTVLENEKNNIKKTSTDGDGERSILFYVLVSLVASIFLACAVFVGFYLFDDRLKTPKEMRDLFGIIEFDLKKGNRGMVAKKIQLLCRGNKAGNVLVVVMANDQTQIDGVLYEVVDNLKLESGEIKVVGNILRDMDSLEMLEEYDDIILAPTTYKTTYGEISDVIQMCETYEKDIIASVVLEG